jgi:hypothetical protein
MVGHALQQLLLPCLDTLQFLQCPTLAADLLISTSRSMQPCVLLHLA